MNVPSEIDWDKADEWDADQAYAELETYVATLAADNADVRKFLGIQKEQVQIVRITGTSGTVEIRVVAAIPWTVRARIARISAETKRAARLEADEWRRAMAGEDIEIRDPDPIATQRPMYEILADLCLDSPWNDWRTWAGIDIQTGAAPGMLERILETIAPNEERIRSFRPKR